MGLYSYATKLGKRMLINLRTNPRNQHRYPEQSTRQARQKYRTATVNGFKVMQRLPRRVQIAIEDYPF